MTTAFLRSRNKLTSHQTEWAPDRVRFYLFLICATPVRACESARARAVAVEVRGKCLPTKFKYHAGPPAEDVFLFASASASHEPLDTDIKISTYDDAQREVCERPVTPPPRPQLITEQ